MSVHRSSPSLSIGKSVPSCGAVDVGSGVHEHATVAPSDPSPSSNNANAGFDRAAPAIGSLPSNPRQSPRAISTEDSKATNPQHYTDRLGDKNATTTAPASPSRIAADVQSGRGCGGPGRSSDRRNAEAQPAVADRAGRVGTDQAGGDAARVGEGRPPLTPAPRAPGHGAAAVGGGASVRRVGPTSRLPYYDTCLITDADGITRRLSFQIRVF